MTTDDKKQKPDECILCQKPLEGRLTKFTDGTRAHDYCWEQAQDYIQDYESAIREETPTDE